MPAYRYRAIHSSGRIAQGLLAAANEWELSEFLGGAGLELIEARVQKEKQPRLRLPKPVSPRMLAVFTSQMGDLLKAGIGFVEALRECAAASDSMQDILTDIYRSINHGTRIAKAFEAYPRIFPAVYVAILNAGESSGDLTTTFAQLARYAESRARLNEQLRRALRYPLFLLTVAFGVIAFMMALVVPKVVGFLNTIDSGLPVMTRLLIAVSTIVANGWWVLILLVLASAVLLSFLHRTSERAALVVDRTFLRLPVFGNVIRKLALARFAHSFTALFQSGVGILGSLRSAKGTLGNRALENAMEEVAQKVQSGSSLSAAMSGTLPAFAIRMIRTGEQSGQLGKSLADIAVAYDREAADTVERMIGSLEPALTILIGMLLAWVVLAVLGPIYGSVVKLNAMGY